MNGIQDKYRIQAYRSTDELENHLSRTGDWAIAVNVWKRCKDSAKFANLLQYPIPSTQSPVPNPQYRDQQSSVTDFLVEETSLPPPLSDFHDLSSASRVSQLPKKKLGSR